jgi:SNF2 family DNA or RNA helicase
MTQNQSDDPAVKTNLILAPVALLEQWKLEIESKTDDGLFSVLIYHGPKKLTSKKEIQKYDVVLTTYHTLMGEWPDVSNIVILQPFCLFSPFSSTTI